MLTGMRQHVGNFPGVTVDKKTGKIDTPQGESTLIDFPGTYSIYPRSLDEQVVYDALTEKDNPNYPDAIVAVIDSTNIERNLLFFSQLYDLQLPTLMILNMTDIAEKRQIEYDLEALSQAFPECTIVESNARVKLGKQRILDSLGSLKKRTGDKFIDEPIKSIEDKIGQERETSERYARIQSIIGSSVKHKEETEKQEARTRKIDRIFVHPFWGYLIFLAVLMVIFQFIYTFASTPMDWIDAAFSNLSSWTASKLSPGTFNDLLTEGIIPGIGGVVIFIPQIALLFFFISILEETGYLSRVVFMMDRFMRPLGLSGKSVVPLMSSVACAIPGVMAARTIPDWKERLITILVAPLMSCSARIPVYTLLIALVIPEEKVFGFMSLQGLVLLAMYLLGTVMAFIVAWAMKAIIKSKEKGFLMLEMPSYKMPRWKNVGVTVWEKVRVFVWDAGRVILAISIILWALATYGPKERMKAVENEVQFKAEMEGLSIEEQSQLMASKKLENSYIGILGKGIEPAIEPLGYDWKIGISLITSFAAREVFVGSMATIYAVEDDGEENVPLVDKMRAETHSDGSKVFSLRTGLSLMVFYVFAMQCMSTLAVVKRETKSWKWPAIQLGYMGVLAYLGAWITYQLF